MANSTLLKLISPLLDAPLDPDADLYPVLEGLVLESDGPGIISGIAHPADNASLNFVATGDGPKWRLARQAGDHPIWRWPGQVAFRITTPPEEARLSMLEIELATVEVGLPFLHGATLSGQRLAADPAHEDVSLKLPGIVLEIKPGSAPGDLSARLALKTLAGPVADPVAASLTPALALVGDLGLVGFSFEGATVLPEGDGSLEALVLEGVRLFAAPPGIPALAIQAVGQGARLHLGANPGLSGGFDLTEADQAGDPALPGFLSDLRWTVRLDRNLLTTFKVRGKADLGQLLASQLGQAIPEDDGIGPRDFTLVASFDGGEWRQRLTFPGGPDGAVWHLGRDQAVPDGILDGLGTLVVFGPLLDPDAWAEEPAPSRLLGLTLGLGMVADILESELVRVQSISLAPGELVTRCITGDNGDVSCEAILFLEIQVALEIKAQVGDVDLVSTRAEHPMVVRQRALGLRLEFGPDPEGLVLSPVLTPPEGFALDVNDPGMFQVPGPLGDILQVGGARLARTNPLNLEIDLGLAADLGVVSVDRASVRIPMPEKEKPLSPPEITALGASMDLGALRGRGYLSLGLDSEQNAVLAGSLDLSLVPLGVRVAAGLAVSEIPGATAVLVTLGTEFPLPIPLYGSGLGVFGFSGLFAMHYLRDEKPDLPQPALDWFEHRAQGDPTKLEAWKPEPNHWAIGIGSVLGTLEGGFVLNMNGMIVFELPGPRLVIFMGARLLSARPGTKERRPGNLLAVIDISGNAIRIGITANYAIKPILDIHVPASAYFPFSPAENFELDLGSFSDPVSVEFLFFFRGSGYLMMHGNGIQGFPLGDLHGFSVAAGAHASITWGLEEIGLYMRVSAGLDVGISFEPFLLLGQMHLSGELHLFIVGVEVSAHPLLIIIEDGNDWRYYVKAPVCGEVEFLFFKVSDCVTLELGDPNTSPPPAPPLVRALSLHSRSPALVHGTATTDRLVDGSLGEASADPATQPVPEVPIDSIPVLQFEMPPAVDPACKPFGQPLPQHPLLPEAGWTRRGERFYCYTLRSITFDGPVGEGDKPSVWWHRRARPGGDDNDIQLAMLNWIPHPTPKAVLRGTHQENSVVEQWGTVCLPVAEPAPVLWTFHQVPLGTSAAGWMVTGLALPDEAGFQRSAPPALGLRVTEPWRTADPLADALLGVTPARVIALKPNPARPGQVLRPPLTPGGLHPQIDDDLFRERVEEAVGRAHPFGDPLEDALWLSAGFSHYVRLLLWWLPELPWEEHLTLRALDAAGQPVEDPLGFDGQMLDHAWSLLDDSQPGVDAARLARWRDALDRAEEQLLAIDQHKFLLLNVALPSADISRVEIGLRDVTDDTRDIIAGNKLPAFFLLAVETLPEGEVRRFDYDETVRDSQIRTINGALGSDPAKQALLQRNQTYTVTVDYTVQAGEEAAADDQKEEYPSALNGRGSLVKVRPSGPEEQRTQRFTFRTDDQAPARLDPWLLCVVPSPGEGFHFWGDPVTVVFGTNAVRQLYGEYGHKLHGVVRAASSRHAAGAPGFPKTHTFLVETAELASVALAPAITLSPWEESARMALRDLDCVPAAHERRLAHERMDLSLLLDPLTDYVFDIEAKPGINPPPGQPSQPLFRRGFSTSRYQNLGEMMSAIAAAPLRHRCPADPQKLVDLAALSEEPAAAVRELDLEAALLASGWGGLEPAQEPRVTIIWGDAQDQGSPPKALGLLLDLPEPLWRWRLVPQKVIDASDPNRGERYELRREAWLELVEMAPGGLVRHFLYTPGGGRTLVIFQPEVPAAELKLGIRKNFNETLDSTAEKDPLPLRTISIGQPPWREEL
ncbi:MAG: hypothetical protein Kow0063_28910 [Anaerolineae bacterium]